jgi:hypothetical protein
MVEKGCRGEYLYYREKTHVAGRHRLAHNTTKHTREYRYSSNIFLKLGARWSWVIKATPLAIASPLTSLHQKQRTHKHTMLPHHSS